MQITAIVAALFSAVTVTSAIPDANPVPGAPPKGKLCYWTPCSITPKCPPHFKQETTAKCANGTTGKALCCRDGKPPNY
ncbi:hypothetical protein BZA77DRAFT_318367 [Pyronema omphalodes]|nr:hypothetical protein BZA77DRAFT_318367 [Pyronema omphalodes]